VLALKAMLEKPARLHWRLRTRAVAVSIPLLGALALGALAGTASSTHGAGARPGRSSASTAPSHAPVPRGPALYRIVGCRSRGYGAYLHGPSRREVAIGFDDGPAPDTGAFLRMLERARARATFFLIGAQVGARYRGTLLRALRDGNVLGDHTFTHPYLTRSGRVQSELRGTISAIRSLTGYTPCIFRPPYGAYDSSVLGVARSLGLATIMWNVDPRDWALPGSGAIERRVLDQIRPGSIIVSHDGGGPRAETLAAYRSIIARLHARGYRLVTIPELLGFRPVYRPCIVLCEGLGLVRARLPRNAIIEKAG
jgi:peptidoglycan/xylan/chitin deacetylase (PgdA/CDA1 family)